MTLAVNFSESNQTFDVEFGELAVVSAGDSPVTSVNGKVGKVNLTAKDVGAATTNDVQNMLTNSSPNYFANRSIDEPDISVEITEEGQTYIFVNTDKNGKAFSYTELIARIVIPPTKDKTSRVTISTVENRVRGLNIAGNNTNSSIPFSALVHIHKLLGKFVIDSVGIATASWLGEMANLQRDFHHLEGISPRDKLSFSDDTITSFNLMLEQGNPLPVGTSLKIWGKPT